MKTMKNKLLLLLVIAFAFVSVVFAVSGLNKRTKVICAEEYAANTAINIYLSDISGTPSDTLTFEYKLVETARTISFVIRNSGGSNIVNDFSLKGDGTLTINTQTDGVDISVGSADDEGYRLVTIVGEGIVSNTYRIYSRNGAYKSVIYIRNVSFYNEPAPEPEPEPEGTIEIEQGTKIDLQSFSGDATDRFSFEYKFANASANVQFCLRSGGAVIVNYFRLNADGTFSIVTETEGVLITVSEGSVEGYYKVTVTGDNIVKNTTRLYSLNGSSSGELFIRELKFEVLPALAMVDGASVRMSAPYGIKFRASVPAELAEDSEITFGMTIIPYEWLAVYSDEIEAANGDYIAVFDNVGVNYRRYNCTPVKEGDDYYIQASLTNIKRGNIAKELIGIAWSEKAGIKTYVLNEDCARSIKDVSVSAIIDGGQYEEEQSEFLRDIAGHDSYTAGDKLTVATSEKAIRGEDYLVFYYKKNDVGTVRFAVINSDDWGSFYGYFTISDTDTIDADGVNVVAIEKDWYKVTLDVSKMTAATNDPSDFTSFDAIYFKGATSSFEVLGWGVETKPAHADRKEFTAGVNFACDLETASYTLVSFDYKITSGEKFDLAILLGWTDGCGYFSFYEAGCTADGVTCTVLNDGYIHVEINLSETTKVIGNGADSFNLFYIRGSQTNASGYIDNIQFA